MDEKGLLTIGKVTGVHGLGGNLKVWSFAESLDTFGKGKQVILEHEDPLPNTPERVGSFRIQSVSAMKKGILLRLNGVDTRNQAERLTGCSILIPRDELPGLDEDTWYWEDLYTLEVRDQTLGHLGTIEQIFPTPARDILVVRDKTRDRETLIPMHRRFVESVDLENRVVKTILPPGFDQVFES